MKKLSWFAAILLVFALITQVSAVPLFPDVPSNHWARDAVAQLAAKGLLEGYPDGTFKGDRAATRWEMAMVVARMLAKSEQMWATFATKEDLEALKQLVNQLRDELDALGVRVTNLEDNVGKLTKRVWDIEKVKFYGSIDSILVSQGVQSTSATDPFGLGTGSIYNVHNAIGASQGTTITPNGYGVTSAGNAAIPGGGAASYSAFPVLDYRTGVPMTNGTSLTTVGILGTKLRISDAVDAGAEFAAYSRVGDFTVAPYYGVVPPYLSNIFTSDIGLTGNTNLNSAWTRMTLDNMWMIHKPSGVKLQVGSFANTSFDPITLYGEPNPNPVSGPRALPYFGFRVTGETQFLSTMKFEVLASKLPNATNTSGAANSTYNTYMSGFTLDWLFKGGDIRINFLRAVDDFFGGTSLQPGGRENPFGWVNPWDYRAAAVPQQRNRPVQAGDGALGLIGPQGQSSFSGSVRYEFQNNLNLEVVYGSTSYQPNLGSNYTVAGQAGLAKLTTSLFHNLLDLAVDYVAVSPLYDPMVFQYPGVLGPLTTYGGPANMTACQEPFWRLGQFAYIPGFFQLHDSELLPNNRQGSRIYLTYHLPSGNGSLFAKYGRLTQRSHTATTINAGNSDRPGYVEPFFPNMTGGVTLGETTRGTVEDMLLGADYKFPNTKLYAKASYEHYRLRRPTALLTGNVNQANNNVNMAENILKIFLSYPTNDKFLLKAGYDMVNFRGAYRSLAVNWDYPQSIPYIGFDYKLSDNTMWSLLAEGYSTGDNVSQTLLNTNAPWRWNGTRLLTEFKISF